MEVDVLEIFCMGVDYGQLLCEQERDGEDLADAFQGAVVSQKYAMPSQIAHRRQPRSEQWRTAKKESYFKFMELWKKVQENKEFIFVK